MLILFYFSRGRKKGRACKIIIFNKEENGFKSCPKNL